MTLLEDVLKLRPVARVARGVADYVDLQWMLTIRSLTRVAPQAKGRLLDVGCGDKPYEKLFLPYVTEYVGVEHEAAFQNTHSSTRERRADYLYDGERLPFDDKSFDTLLSVQVLEHTPQPQRLVSEMARLMKDDGLLILMAPFSFRLHEEPNDYFRYSPHGLRELCRRAALQVTSVEPLGSLWSLMGQKLNSYLVLQVARAGAMGQAFDKLGHETTVLAKPRVWTFPLVGPALIAVSTSARVFDRILPDPTETLGFTITARRE